MMPESKEPLSLMWTSPKCIISNVCCGQPGWTAILAASSPELVHLLEQRGSRAFLAFGRITYRIKRSMNVPLGFPETAFTKGSMALGMQCELINRSSPIIIQRGSNVWTMHAFISLPIHTKFCSCYANPAPSRKNVDPMLNPLAKL